jgi:predicted anti-sigma-YlaC factor YlaD
MKTHSNTLRSACKDFEADLVLYYYGDNARAERARVESHLKSCPPCHEFLDDLQRLLPAMAKSSELSPGFWDNYYKETMQKLAAQQERQVWWKNLFQPLRGWMLPAFGTAAVAALAVGLVIGRGHWDYPSGQTQERIPQEILADSNQLEFFKSLDMLEALSKLEALDGTKLEAGRSHG